MLFSVIMMPPIFAETLISPTKQLELGVTLEKIRCNDDKILLKSPRGMPVCLSSDSAERLMYRGGYHKVLPLILESVSSPITQLNEKLTNSVILSQNQSIPTQTLKQKPTNILSNLEMINKLSHKPSQEPKLSIPPVTYQPMSKVSVGGFGFNPGNIATIDIFDSSGKNVITKKIITQHDNYFKKSIQLPQNAAYGTWIAKYSEGSKHLESTFQVGEKYVPVIIKQTIDENFDNSVCNSTDDPILIYKCWEQDKIAKNIDCGWLNYAKPACHPPSSVYREYPSFNEILVVDLIPSDIIFESQIKITPDDVDAFANKMINFMDDKLVEKIIIPNSHKIRYETEKGTIFIGSSFEYTIYGEGRINPNVSKVFTADFIDQLGITLDGTEFYREGAKTSYYTHQFWQKKDGIKITSNTIYTMVEPGYTVFGFTNWNTNLSKMNLYDVQESIKNGHEFALNNKELSGIDCQVEIQEDTKEDITLVIFQERPLYDVYGGSCKVQSHAGHSGWYSVYVDALTGKPLFIQNRAVF